MGSSRPALTVPLCTMVTGCRSWLSSMLLGGDRHTALCPFWDQERKSGVKSYFAFSKRLFIYFCRHTHFLTWVFPHYAATNCCRNAGMFEQRRTALSKKTKYKILTAGCYIFMVWLYSFFLLAKKELWECLLQILYLQGLWFTSVTLCLCFSCSEYVMLFLIFAWFI